MPKSGQKKQCWQGGVSQNPEYRAELRHAGRVKHAASLARQPEHSAEVATAIAPFENARSMLNESSERQVTMFNNWLTAANSKAKQREGFLDVAIRGEMPNFDVSGAASPA